MSDEQLANNAVYRWFKQAKAGIYTTADVQADLGSSTELDIHGALRRLVNNQDGFNGTVAGGWQVCDPLVPTRRGHR